MKIVDIAVKKVYRFNCPNCQSRLEADSKEVVDIGGKVCKFHCPVCRKERYIAWSDMICKSTSKIIFRMNNKSFYGTVNEFTKGELKWVKTSKNC